LEDRYGRYTLAKLIKKGAEADLYLIEWCGEKALKKIRAPKLYLNRNIDKKIMTLRTAHEALFLLKARCAGISTPLVYYVNPTLGEIIMQYVEGMRVKDILSEMSASESKTTLRNIGRNIGLLHSSSIIHGDLTTSNFIITSSGKVVFIDFGLSYYSLRLEDKAVDLHLFSEVLKSVHGHRANIFIKHVFAGYSEIMGEPFLKTIMPRIQEISKRGRYAKVV